MRPLHLTVDPMNAIIIALWTSAGVGDATADPFDPFGGAQSLRQAHAGGSRDCDRFETEGCATCLRPESTSRWPGWLS